MLRECCASVSAYFSGALRLGLLFLRSTTTQAHSFLYTEKEPLPNVAYAGLSPFVTWDIADRGINRVLITRDQTRTMTLLNSGG